MATASAKKRTTKKRSLLEIVKEKPNGNSWLDRLSVRDRALMYAIRQSWRAGEIEKGPMKVHEDIANHLGDRAPSETTLRRFLGSKPSRQQ